MIDRWDRSSASGAWPPAPADSTFTPLHRSSWRAGEFCWISERDSSEADANMPNGSVTLQPPGGGRPRRGNRRRTGGGGRREVYPLRKFALAYLAALGVWFGSKLLFLGSFTIGSFLISALIYYACGYALTRYISQRVVYNQNFATIASVSDAKLGAVLRWPVAVPYFIWQIFVARYF